jgi:methylenetetrahydrofolate reductase (NADPH)
LVSIPSSSFLAACCGPVLNAMQKAKELGIQNILALRGDQPRSAEYATTPNPEPDFFTHADDLVRYIRAEHGSYFCIGVAGYPTPHPDSESAETEMHWLKVKCDAGADFIVTQLFYDVPHFAEWVKDCRAKGERADVSIRVQCYVLTLHALRNHPTHHTRRHANPELFVLPATSQPDQSARSRLNHGRPGADQGRSARDGNQSRVFVLTYSKSDDAAVKRYGAQLATNMVRRLLASGVVPGVHFCTLNLEKSVRTILENLDWKSPTPNARQSSPLPRHNQLIDIDDDGAHSHGQLAAVPQEFSGMSISPAKASQLAEWGLTHSALPPAPKKSTGAPSGAPGQGEDSWDEYPNGRFTDVRSPAYGEIDGWGSGLKITVSHLVLVLHCEMCYAAPSLPPLRRPPKLSKTGAHPRLQPICPICSLPT